jgi:hypothetical protein
MKYRFTPFNIFAAYLLVCIISLFCVPDEHGWNAMSIVIVLPAFFIVLGLDFAIQFGVKKYKTILIIEGIIVGALLLCFWLIPNFLLHLI